MLVANGVLTVPATRRCGSHGEERFVVDVSTEGMTPEMSLKLTGV